MNYCQHYVYTHPRLFIVPLDDRFRPYLNTRYQGLNDYINAIIVDVSTAQVIHLILLITALNSWCLYTVHLKTNTMQTIYITFHYRHFTVWLVAYSLAPLMTQEGFVAMVTGLQVHRRVHPDPDAHAQHGDGLLETSARPQPQEVQHYRHAQLHGQDWQGMAAWLLEGVLGCSVHVDTKPTVNVSTIPHCRMSSKC